MVFAIGRESSFAASLCLVWSDPADKAECSFVVPIALSTRSNFPFHALLHSSLFCLRLGHASTTSYPFSPVLSLFRLVDLMPCDLLSRKA
jgi:hypothetical protein